MKLRAGTIGIENLCKRSSKGDSEGLDVEYIVKGGDYDARKVWAVHAPRRHHGGARQSRRDSLSLLRAIFEAVNAIDPNDVSPAGGCIASRQVLRSLISTVRRSWQNSRLSRAARSRTVAPVPTRT